MSLKICIPAIAAFLLAACGGDGNSVTDCKDEAISSSSSAKSYSSSSVTLATPCKTTSEDNCEYGELVDDRDGRTYVTVKIGDQVWMIHGLSYKTENSWCGGGRGGNEGDCSLNGRLYTWAAAVGKSEDKCGYGFTCGLSGMVRGVCPEGWHLPTYTEWETLFAAVGGRGYAGMVLKSQVGWKGGSDAYGFHAWPAGLRGSDGSFYYEGDIGDFWSASEYDSDQAFHMFIYYGNNTAGLNYGYKNNALSVRCIQD
jgi:Fibrobacter succinogenes major domain (Fib_succ_major).